MDVALRPLQRSKRRFFFAFAALGLILVSRPALAQRLDPTRNLAPFVPSPQLIVDRMLELASIKEGETVYDLGCGDGRILITAAQKFRAKAVGVELSADLAKTATENIRRAGIENRARVIHGNLLEVDLSPADIVTVYLLTSSNDLLKPNLEKYLRPGARVVSHDFQIRGWTPVMIDKVYAHNRLHTIYLYEIRKK